jgi:hypothetical protein
VSRKIPENAFAVYAAMGEKRSYQAIADRFGVSKRSVVKRAIAEGWQERLVRAEATAREKVDAKAAESLEVMNARHLKIIQAIQTKAIETLSRVPLRTAFDAVRALELSIRQERLIRGEPSDRTVLSIEEVIRREYQMWLRPAAEEVSDGNRN